MHNPTDKIAHTSAFVILVVEHWLEREIAQWVHHEGSIRRHFLKCVDMYKYMYKCSNIKKSRFTSCFDLFSHTHVFSFIIFSLLLIFFFFKHNSKLVLLVNGINNVTMGSQLLCQTLLEIARDTL